MDNKSYESLNIIKEYNNDLKDKSKIIEATKYIKNSIIGNPKKKKEFILNNTIPLLINILKKEKKDENLLIQVICILGSFACKIDEGAKEICESEGLEPLVSLLSHNNLKLVESAARTIKFLLSDSFYHPNMTFMFQDDGINLLTNLVNQSIESIQEISISIIALGCENLFKQQKNNNNNNNNNDLIYNYQIKLLKSGIFENIIKLLLNSKSRLQEVCLYAVELMTRDNQELCHYFVNRSEDSHAELKVLVQLAKGLVPRTKLLAANVVCNIYQTKSLPPSFTPTIGKIIPIIIRLMNGKNNDNTMISNIENHSNHSSSLSSSSSLEEEIPAFLARIVSESEDLQRVAAECETLTKLVGYIRDPKSSDKLLENALSALAVLCSQREESRKQVAESKIIPSIVLLLESSRPNIRAAACQCIKSLSRSIKQLRTHLYDSAVGKPVAKLLTDPSPQVRITAIASICNLVLDFSPMKQEMVNSGVIVQLVNYLTSVDNDISIRLNSAWALKNMLFLAEPSIKEALLKEISIDGLITLVKDSPPSIVEQIVSLLRNLVYKDTTNLISEDMGLKLIKLVEYLLFNIKPGGGDDIDGDIIMGGSNNNNSNNSNHNSTIIKQSLFVICNLVCNKVIHRNQVIHCSILKKLINFLENPIIDDETKLTSAWCLTNLVKFDDQEKTTRISILKDHGCIDKVNLVLSSNNCNEDLKARCQTLYNLMC